MSQEGAHNLVSSVSEENSRLKAQVGLLKKKITHLEHKISFQAQSGLPTHFRLDIDLDGLIEAENARKEIQGFTILIVKLGQTYAMVRKTLRSSISEWLLYQTGCRMNALLGPRDRVYHTREDEFVLILPGVKGPGLKKFLRNLLPSLRGPHIFTGFTVSLPVTSGAAYFPEHGRNRSNLMHFADVAAGSAQERKRSFVLFRPSLLESVVERVELQNSIIRAIEAPAIQHLGKQFSLVFQPKLVVSDVEDRILRVERIEAEALLRWNHPQKGPIPPATFIPLAEETGLIEPLGKWIVYQCVRQLASWEKSGRGDIGLSINLSPRQFRSGSVEETLAGIFASSRIPEGRLTVELTESSLFEDAEVTAKILESFAGMGVRISVDDFGTGYSSLSHLHRFPLDEIKIDQLFVENLHQNHQDRSIVRSLVSIARDMDLDLTAEGVERLDTLQSLYLMGCRGFQGFLLSRPLSAEGLLRFRDSVVEDGMVFRIPEGSPGDAAT
ncbi:MAG TPA: GGDEF domain-containing phosphodiesterase [Magnetospirillaceae bacterium]|nr:GGDEF domain-containing phosphodiesterase [Magnetospirillaceae bacterium]